MGTGRCHSNRLHPSGGTGHRGGRTAEGPEQSSQDLLAFEEERLCVHRLGCFQPGWVGALFLPLSANVPSTRSQQAPLDFSRKAAVPSKETSHLEVICVVCELCVHASGRPLFGSPSKFRCQQERPGCAHSSVPVQREWLWAPGILRASSERALLPFATQFRGKRVRPAQFDGAQIQTGALPTPGGEKLSNLKINVHGPNGVLIKM